MKARWNTRLECLIQGLCVRREEYIRERERERERERKKEKKKTGHLEEENWSASRLGAT